MDREKLPGRAHALANGSLRTEPLTSHRFPIEQAAAAYELLSSPEPSLGILLQYSGTADPLKRTVALSADPTVVSPPFRSDQLQLGVIGAGNYASRVLIPARAGARFHTLVASSGIGPVHVAQVWFPTGQYDVPALLADPLQQRGDRYLPRQSCGCQFSRPWPPVNTSL